MSFAHNYMLEYRKACEIFPVLEKKGKCLQVLSDIALSDTGQRNVF